jgi:hypothetical protein
MPAVGCSEQIERTGAPRRSARCGESRAILRPSDRTGLRSEKISGYLLRDLFEWVTAGIV